jgi:hypothetical protein
MTGGRSGRREEADGSSHATATPRLEAFERFTPDLFYGPACASADEPLAGRVRFDDHPSPEAHARLNVHGRVGLAGRSPTGKRGAWTARRAKAAREGLRRLTLESEQQQTNYTPT